MTRSRVEIKKILRLYKTLAFPGSFSTVEKFRRALKDHELIDISSKELKEILKNDLERQMQSVKPRNPKMRHVTSIGVTVQGQVDVVFVNLSIPPTLAEKERGKGPETLKYAFLVNIDVLSRYMYAVPISFNLNPETLKAGFEELIKGPQKMPHFSILRCDADKAMIQLKKYFSDMGTLLEVKRGLWYILFCRTLHQLMKNMVRSNILIITGPHHFGILDIYVKYLKTRIISYLKMHPKKNFPEVLHQALTSYNETYSDLLQGTPASLNSNYFDPILRARLYKHHPKLQPFEEFYKNQLRLQKKISKTMQRPPKVKR